MSAHLCGCTEPATCICWCHGAGSSVPEAARAAEWEAVSRRIGPIQPETFLAAAKAYTDGGPTPLGSAVIAAIQQFAPTIVAAAVAEERATTGRLRGAFEEAAWQHAETVDSGWACCHVREQMKAGECDNYGSGWPQNWLLRLLPAALASPGEET